MLGKTYGTNRGALWNMLRNTVSTWGNLLVTDWELDRNIVLTHWAQQKSKRKRIWVYWVLGRISIHYGVHRGMNCGDIVVSWHIVSIHMQPFYDKALPQEIL
jgi:hypothetical protein